MVQGEQSATARRSGRGPITRRLVQALHIPRGESVTIGIILDRLGPDAFGIALLLLSLPMVIPMPGPIGFPLGCLIGLLAIQALRGAKNPTLPTFIRERPVSRRLLRSILVRSLPWMARAERHVREERLSWLTGRAVRVLLAVPVLLLAVAIILPLGNSIPAVALIVLAVGWIVRDGAAVLIAFALSIAALAWCVFLVIAGVTAIDWLASIF